ncbi:phosphoenolpyruvate synthase [Methanopyrus kandleri]|uniref:Phosphoenolpyruvate synthase n=2 Tax=Methanopyrus kandleri TaxID=2320 RepID=Q8TYP1_METKA|nr:phosphoenolpyruvate synthase [Methanopyrus kandleri]AAM01469.1 Phosphoenolpyruvate synthase/pyruvate phosphate dikinase [Methanopyrus kandleri AV19]HII70605.1 phosphoenolpyruvate synthase [Methanopyrus kandleri]
MKYVRWFEEISKDDVDVAGGKGANLGEMTQAGLPVPPGFVVLSTAYDEFLERTGLKEKIKEILSSHDLSDNDELQEAAEEIQRLIVEVEMPEEIREEIVKAYRELCEKVGKEEEFVAVRSSATAEDLPEASFAGQQETFLNVQGEEDVVKYVQKCWASLFTPRAVAYREEQGFEHLDVSIAVVVQKMVDSEKSGVMFTVHPYTGERDKMVIEAVWGLGEAVVSGEVTPDTYIVDKNTFEVIEEQISEQEWMYTKDPETGETVKAEVPEDKRDARKLTDEEIKELAEIGVAVEEHYGFPQDIEWAIEDDEVYVLQSRPVTTIPEEKGGEEEIEAEELEGKILVRGLGASPGIGTGEVKIVMDVDEIDKVEEGDVLVTKMTTPDMVPAMRKASAIVTDEGGITCHAAIVSRELGIPCVVGTGNATEVLEEGQVVTVDGERGVVYEGDVRKALRAEEEEEEREEKEIVVERPAAEPVTATEIKVNVSMPEAAERAAKTGADGVGLLRIEHMILGVGVHPRKLIEEGEREKLVQVLMDGIRKVADAFYPKPVWVRTLDAPTDEFRELEGGEREPEETNPMLGWRGIRRDLEERETLECQFEAIRRLHQEGYDNIGVMIPLVQHPEELRRAKRIAKEVGLKPHRQVEFGMMVETPAAAVLIDEFIEVGLDFVSLGTNDLTQYTLAVDRNNDKVAYLYDEKHPAVLRLIKHVINECKEAGVKTSICGQAGSDPKMAEILVKAGIDSISANIDAVPQIRRIVARVERKILLDKMREF